MLTVAADLPFGRASTSATEAAPQPLLLDITVVEDDQWTVHDELTRSGSRIGQLKMDRARDVARSATSKTFTEVSQSVECVG